MRICLPLSASIRGTCVQIGIGSRMSRECAEQREVNTWFVDGDKKSTTNWSGLGEATQNSPQKGTLNLPVAVLAVGDRRGIPDPRGVNRDITVSHDLFLACSIWARLGSSWSPLHSVRRTSLLTPSLATAMPSKRVVQLCSSSETITSSLAHEYASGRTNVGAGGLKKKLWRDVEDADGPDEESFLENIARCGKWNERPGELFLKVAFHLGRCRAST
jgi:hypothetical protein